MGDAPLIVGVSGLRGIVGESLTPEVAVRYAGAFGAWLNEQTGGEKWPYVLLARDGREGGEAIYYAAMSALISTGCRVCELGVAMTPTVGVMLDAKRADAAMIVTASHNPQEWNGLKALIRRAGWEGQTDGRTNVIESEPDACAPDATTAKAIVSAFEAGLVAWEPSATFVDSTNEHDSADPHCLKVLDACSALTGVEYFWDLFEDSPMRVVIDAVNCSGRKADQTFFTDTPVHAVHLFAEASGVFPHTPEPTAENLSGEGGLCDAVPGLKADVGFAQDPDADRLAIVDENGRYIGEEYTLALCAESVLSWVDTAPEGTPRRSTGQPVLVANLSTSRMIDDVAAKHGGRVVRTPVGEANVVEVMKSLKREGASVVLGGEGNGGVIWPEVVYVRDSLGSMALVLSLMARTGKTVSELVAQIDSYSPGGAGYGIVKRKVEIASKADAQPAVDKIAAHYKGRTDATIDLQDGVRVDFPEQGVWVHVRASNTEPIMRLIAEAPTDEAAQSILAEVEGVIAG